MKKLIYILPAIFLTVGCGKEYEKEKDSAKNIPIENQEESDSFLKNYEIQNLNLAHPSGYDTYILDEAMITFEDLMTPEQITTAFKELNFETKYIEGLLRDIPIYRIGLPGTENGEQLEEKMALIEALPDVEFVGKNRVGRAVEFF